MAFQLPAFNLDAFIFPGYGEAPLPPPPGTQAAPTKVQIKVYFTALATGVLENEIGLLVMKFPKGTDVRVNRPGDRPDLVEAPQNSGRFYGIEYTTEVAKGFANEYVMALARDLIPL